MMNKFEQGQAFTVGDECSVLVENKSGDVRISAWERSEIGAAEDSDQVSMERHDGEIYVRPARGWSDDISLRVPRHCDVRVRSHSGDVEVKGVDSRIDIQSMSGDIQADEIKGELRVHSVSGDVSASGSALHKLDLDTVSGTLVVRAALDPEGSYSLHSISGNVKLRVPSDQPCTIDFASISGDLRCDLPYTSDVKGRGQVEARIHGGGVRVQIRTTSGSARIGAWAAEQPAPEPAMAEERPLAGRDTRPLNEETVASEPFGLEEEPDVAEPSAESDEQETFAARRMRILREIEAGHLTVSEGLERLRALE